MFSKVRKCYFVVIASSLAKFKPKACAIILCGWEMSLWRETLRARGLDVFIFQFFTCLQIRFLFKSSSGDLLGCFLPGPSGIQH